MMAFEIIAIVLILMEHLYYINVKLPVDREQKLCNPFNFTN